MFWRKVFLLGILVVQAFGQVFPTKAQEDKLDNPLEKLIINEKTTATVPTTLEGSLTKILERNSQVAVALDSVLCSELNVIGDPVQATILVKPNKHGSPNDSQALKGTKLLGQIIEIKPSRRAGRAGYIRVSFNRLQTRSGKQFPVQAEMTTRGSTSKEVGKIILYDAKLIALGSLWGTYNSLKWSPVAAFYTNGISVAVSAGIGAGLGLIGAFRRKGEIQTFLPGAKERVKFQNSFSLDRETLAEIALANEPPIHNKLIGLEMQILQTKMLNSVEFENILRLEIKLKNKTNSLIYPCDFMLIPKDGSNPVIADLRQSGLDILQSISQGEENIITLIYPIQSQTSSQDYSLVLVDPLGKTYLSELPLP